jgi:PAS domain S-box-containing protein
MVVPVTKIISNDPFKGIFVALDPSAVGATATELLQMQQLCCNSHLIITYFHCTVYLIQVTFLVRGGQEASMSCFIAADGIHKDCFETILQTMAEAVFLVDTDGTIRFGNLALERLCGKPLEELLGLRCHELLECSCGSTSACDLFQKGELNSAECRVRHEMGGGVAVLKNGRLIRNSAGEVLGAVETLTDISALKNTQSRVEELERAIGSAGGYENIIGKSHVMKELFNLIELAANSHATVLVTGESGTGKELVATAIHNRSSRAGGPLVRVNCSALPESLLESELFGHAKGAFTGAIRDKIGRFELADHGTLFLDEIGEVSPLIQVKLLRFLQEREFERVGESQTRKSDVRIITATNRNLLEMVRKGEFREDLYYRLKVFPLHLPPLRERKEDIGLLVNHFVKKFNAETGKNLSGLSHDAAITLMDYCWPGNIRELENAIEHAFVTCGEGKIDLFDLPLEIRRVELRSGMCSPRQTLSSSGGESPFALPRKARQLQGDEILALLEQFGGNRSRLADYLGMDRTTIWRKLKRLGVE